jgi:peptidyl-prolyl cis-trans isomerase D
MLDVIRSKQKSLLIKVAFGIIILSFVIGYTMLTAPSDPGANQANDIAARVNGAEISYSAYQNTYSNLYNLYQNIYQDRFNAALEKQLNLPQQALQQLVEEQLLVQQAAELGLSVAKSELIASIAQFDAFQVNGQFNRQRYLEVLNYQRMTPEQFEAAQRRQLLTEKVRQRLQQGASVEEEDLKAAFHRENDKINLNYVWLTPELVESKVEVTAADLKTFFQENIEQFRIPEKVAIRYLQFDPARYEDQIAPFTDQDLERYYRRNIQLYEIEEQVTASHILLQVAEDADAETVAKRRQLANDLLEQLQQGANFAQLARIHSDDQSNAEQGGSLGTFGRGMMVEDFEKAAFSLQPGQLSEVVETPFGFHIIKVTEHIEPGIKPLVDVIDQVKAGLTAERARQLAYEKAMDAYNIQRKSGDLAAAAEANDLGLKETGLFSANEAIDGIGRQPEISQAAFALSKGELARPVQTEEGVFLFTLKQRQASRLPELDAVKPQVVKAYREQRAQTLAEELANKLLTLAKESNELPQAAEELGLNIEETGPFSRGFGDFIPRIGSHEQLAEDAFALTEKNPIAPKIYRVDQRFLVAALESASVADFTALSESERQQLQERLLQQEQDDMVAKKLEQLYQQAQIEIFIPELSNALESGRLSS